MKKIDIDTLLSKNRLELTLGGKVFEVKDVTMTTFLETASGDMEKDKNLIHKQLAVILKVDEKELKDVGIKASGLTLNAIREWLTDTAPEPSPDVPSDVEPTADKASAPKRKNP